MRIIFMGTPEFAVCSLERLIESEHDVVAVVTRPDRGAGRGRAMQAPPIKELALQHNIPVMQPERLRDEATIQALRDFQPDLIVVVAYGKILPPAILEMPPLGCINVHASLLPELRGAAPINWAIILGFRETGVTIMKMDAGMDTGDIIVQEKVEILEDDDAESLGNMLSVLGAQSLLDVVGEAAKNGSIASTAQDNELATYAPMMKKEFGQIDWTRTTEEIICLIQGTKPWPGAFTVTSKMTLKILRAEPIWPSAEEQIVKPKKFKPGAVALVIRSQGFAVRTGSGFIFITEGQPEGKRVMSGVDLANGGYVKLGDQFVSRERVEIPESK